MVTAFVALLKLAGLQQKGGQEAAPPQTKILPPKPKATKGENIGK